jgi:hypothetical protein
MVAVKGTILGQKEHFKVEKWAIITTLPLASKLLAWSDPDETDPDETDENKIAL